MSWHVEYEGDDSVSIVHENGFVLFAKKGIEQGGHTEWTIEVTDTSTGTEIVQKTHQISNEQHLRSVLDNYTEIYPP